MNMTFEGYVGKDNAKENFNGIVFLLREPNTGGEDTKEFWFREVTEDFDGYYKKLKNDGVSNQKISTSKKAASLYKKSFNLLLKQIGSSNKKLTETGYYNLFPGRGNSTVSPDYKSFVKDEGNVYRKVEAIITEMPSKEYTIFTVNDIFDKLASCDLQDMKMFDDGIKYSRSARIVTKRKLCFKMGAKDITVYEIFHPSYTRAEVC